MSTQKVQNKTDARLTYRFCDLATTSRNKYVLFYVTKNETNNTLIVTNTEIIKPEDCSGLTHF
jgi:hypothetical protein